MLQAVENVFLPTQCEGINEIGVRGSPGVCYIESIKNTPCV
jgi:hypothetical protein